MKAKSLVKYLVRAAGDRRNTPPASLGEVNYAVAAARLLLGRDPSEQELAEVGATNEPMTAFRYFISRPDQEAAFNQIIATRDLPRGRYLTEPDHGVLALLQACGVLDKAGAQRAAGEGWPELIKHVCSFIGGVLNPEFRAAKKRAKLVLWALSGTPAAGPKQREVYQYLLGYYLNLYKYLDEAWYRSRGFMAGDGPAVPLEHYIQVGAPAGFAPNAYFDPAFYRASIDRAIPAHVADLVDYCTLGWKEGGKPGPTFMPAGYLRANPDVAAALFEPLSHYIRFGLAEGRQGGLVAPRAVRSNAPAVAGIPLLGRPYEKLIRFNPKVEPPARPADPSRLRIDWVIPDFVPGAGGHMAIFKLIYWLELKGHEVHIWIDYPAERNDVMAIYQDILRYFRPLKCQVHMLSERDRVETDVLFLTDRWSVWSGLKAFKAHAVFYFVQDLEIAFNGAGSETILTEHGYRLGLPAICSSPWLAEKMRSYGSEVTEFTYPADPDLYFPPERERYNPSPVIAFYSRASTKRRAVELAVLGLVELHNRGVDFTVAMFGQAFDDTVKWPFAAEHHQVLTERQLGDLFRRADIGLVLSATNYSITAVEMMACGLPVIDVDTQSTRATYPAGTAILAEPTPEGIADAIEAAIGNKAATAERTEKAAKWVAASRWRDIADSVEKRVLAELESAGGVVKTEPSKELAAPATIGRALKATVVIPTYNGEARLAEVLDVVVSQAGPIEFDILCIDSGSTDKTLDIIGGREAVRLHQIPKAAFNHGGTRNLGVEQSDSEYVAFLTQDALPSSSNWLFDLVGVLNAVPSAAGAFGRHHAYPEASPFTKRDLDAHFDLIKTGAPVIAKYSDMDRFDERDEQWLSLLRFFSNNNSCISRKAWLRIPFPEVNFGEDQAWAWKVLKSGYSKVFVDAASVFHSHDYDIEQERNRARTEAAFYRLHFGVQFGVDNGHVVQSRTDLLNGADMAFAMENKIGWPLLQARMKLNRAKMEGFLLGDADEVVVY